MATETTQVDPKVAEREAAEKEAAAVNEKRSGVGTRVHVGSTRGKASLVIKWEAFDESKPETLPTTIQQFMEVTSVKDEPSLVGFLIDGYNNANYIAASDPLAEYVDPTWPDDAQTQFRLVVRNYSRGAGVSIEDAVALIKPGFAKQFTPAK
jgi:hypothetical protein